jgi:hypothetical protein
MNWLQISTHPSSNSNSMISISSNRVPSLEILFVVCFNSLKIWENSIWTNKLVISWIWYVNGHKLILCSWTLLDTWLITSLKSPYTWRVSYPQSSDQFKSRKRAINSLKLLVPLPAFSLRWKKWRSNKCRTKPHPQIVS